MGRRSRHVAFYCCLAVSALLIGSWALSLSRYQRFSGPLPGYRVIGATSYPGRLELSIGIDYVSEHKWDGASNPNEQWLENMRREKMDWPSKHFRLTITNRYWTIQLPYWFLTLLSASLAILARPKPRFRFGLRELMAITLVVAVALSATLIIEKLLSQTETSRDTEF